MSGMEVTYDEVNAVATEAKNTGDQFLQMIDALRGRVDSLTASWRGLGSDAFQGMFADIYQQLRPIQDTLNGIGDGLTNAAEAYAETDQAIQSGFSG